MTSETFHLSLGVEIEALANRGDALELLRVHLHQNSISATIIPKQSDIATEFNTEQWVLSEDMTAVPDSDSDAEAEYLGIELRSPIFVDDGAGGEQRQRWQGEIQHLMSVLNGIKDPLRLQITSTAGLHVHIGQGKSALALPALKNLAWIHYEYAKELRDGLTKGRASEFNSDLFAFPQDNPLFARLSRDEAKRIIQRAPNTPTLTKIICPETPFDLDPLINWAKTTGDYTLLQDSDVDLPRDSRAHALNLVSLTKYRTVEFRHHEGTLNSDTICRWVALVTAIVRTALSHDTDEVMTWQRDTFQFSGEVVPKDVYESWVARPRT